MYCSRFVWNLNLLLGDLNCHLLPSWLPSFFLSGVPVPEKIHQRPPREHWIGRDRFGGVCSERMRRSTAPSLSTTRTNLTEWILRMTWLDSWKVVLWFLCSKAHVLNRQSLLLERYQKPSALNHGCSQRKPVVLIKKWQIFSEPSQIPVKFWTILVIVLILVWGLVREDGWTSKTHKVWNMTAFHNSWKGDGTGWHELCHLDRSVCTWIHSALPGGKHDILSNFVIATMFELFICLGSSKYCLERIKEALLPDELLLSKHLQTTVHEATTALPFLYQCGASST